MDKLNIPSTPIFVIRARAGGPKLAFVTLYLDRYNVIPSNKRLHSMVELIVEMERNSISSANKVWDSVRAYTVQCASCSKWRLVPSKEKYEEIRETIDEQPFTCDTARQWKPDVSCDKESDVQRDDDQNWLWAMDKPNIPRTPKGWQRIIRSRAEGGTKFADVYYVTPSNKRLRSMVELSRYLGEHPQLAQDGVTTSQFSFQPPVRFVDNHVPKRRGRSSSRDIRGTHMTAIVPYEHPESGARDQTLVEPRAESSGNPMLAMVPYANKE
ncbi:putative methyl-CpG-binding domain protein 12 [Henckelia pumila]|uniref:putative methyl-CpG-binding domain protein 12 n=1 Tax=Henckelia pumila TaxID=405737 RepID=UPI003C6E26BA